jgi:DNA-binding NtrC family response regulator
VRELKNVVERTCILSSKSEITAYDLSFLKTKKSENPVQQIPAESDSTTDVLSLSEMERKHIIHVLGLVNGHRGKAARLLEINPKTLYLKMKAYNIVSVYE